MVLYHFKTIAFLFCCLQILIIPYPRREFHTKIPPLAWAAVAGAGERWYHKLSACMLGSTGCGFMGHGYDDILGLVGTMEVFAMADTMGFITRYPELCPEFTELYRETLSYIEERVANGTLAGAWGDDHTAAGMGILRRNGIM